MATRANGFGITIESQDPWILHADETSNAAAISFRFEAAAR